MPKTVTSFGGPRANPQGHPTNGGRPPGVIRAAYRMAFAERLKFLCDVADCKIKRTVSVVAMNGKVVKIQVEPSIGERVRAVEVIGKFSGVATLRAEDEAPDPPPPAQYDLRKLTAVQLLQFEKLLTLAAGEPVLRLSSGVEVHQHETD